MVSPAARRESRSGCVVAESTSVDRRSAVTLLRCASGAWQELPRSSAVAFAVAALTASGSSAAIQPVLVARPIAGPPSSIAALGDSYNTGFDAGPQSGDSPGLSWSTGDDPKVDSLYLRLLAREPGGEGPPLSGRPRRLEDRRSRAPDRDRGRPPRAAPDGAVGRQRHLQRKDPDHATPPTVVQGRVHAGARRARERLPNARLLLTSITDEARWNDGSALIPGNGKKLSDGTVCDPKLDERGRAGPLEARRDPDARAPRRRDPAAPSARPIRTAAGTAARSSGSHTARPTCRRTTRSTRRSPASTGSRRRPGTSASTTRIGGPRPSRPRPRSSVRACDVRLAAHDPRRDRRHRVPDAPRPVLAVQKALMLNAGATVVYRSVDRNGNVSSSWSLTAPSG